MTFTAGQPKSSPSLEAYPLHSLQDYIALRETLTAALAERRETEMSFVRSDQPHFEVDGYCAYCEAPSEFSTSMHRACLKTPDGRDIPLWRELLVCTRCRLNNRVRSGLQFFYQLLKPDMSGDIYITEQSTHLFRTLAARHPNLVGSEYLETKCALGDSIDGLRNEDLTRLTFAPDSFDFVLSFDVMEHVGDDVAAMHSVYRCLRPGGSFLWQAPFSALRKDKVVRAVLHDDGSIEHILPPEYHGNPVNAEGALCFRYFAWDALEDLRSAGFTNCRAIFYWSRTFGYFGDHLFTFIADKPAS